VSLAYRVLLALTEVDYRAMLVRVCGYAAVQCAVSIHPCACMLQRAECALTALRASDFVASCSCCSDAYSSTAADATPAEFLGGRG
jgi:hypothetical protein